MRRVLPWARRLRGPLWDYWVAPAGRIRVTRYHVQSPAWEGDSVTVALVSDIHAIAPAMSSDRIARVVARTNALGAELILLLGDYVRAHWMGRPLSEAEIAQGLAGLAAPLGVHAVLGNHDWQEDPVAHRRQAGPVAMGEALEAVGIPVLENEAVLIERPGGAFWLAGLGDQRAFRTRPRRGVDDLAATLRAIGPEGPAILMAHEPDIFPEVPARVALTVSGHTHGGQIRIFGRTPVVPSRFGSRYVYGHIREDGRDLVVSGGLGCSSLPLRLGVIPEIVLVRLSQ